jgi:hypothetical protein
MISLKYDLTTGEILGYMKHNSSRTSNEVAESVTRPNTGLLRDENLIEGHNYYYHLINEEITTRPDNTATIDQTTMSADGVDTTTISNLPNPSIVHFNDEGDYDVTDGTFEFTVDTVGSYEIIIESFPYKPITFTVVAS